MAFDAVTTAYGARAAEYIDAVGRVEHVPDGDREAILRWATAVRGRVLDVGSGPGQWTDYLRRHGVAIEGVEPVPEFLSAARGRYPDSRFHEGRAESLPVADASLGGVLAWYSLIHADPAAMHSALDEFARVIAPGGSLFVGFFTGAALQPFDHAVTTAYYWPVELFSQRIESAGFAVQEARARFDPTSIPQPGKRPEAIIVATRDRG